MISETITSCPVRYWATLAPAQQAMRGPQGTLSYADLDRRINGVQRQLTGAGLKDGDRLAAVISGAVEDVLLAWACLRNGIVLCPLNPAFPTARQASLAAKVEVEAFHSMQPVPPGPWQRLTVDFDSACDSQDDAPWHPERISNLILTSGSSGAPKAVAHRLANHLASARGSATLIPLDRDSAWLLSLPLFHVGGYAIPFRVFLAGATLVLDDRATPLKQRLERDAITHLSLVPTQLWRLLAEGWDPGRTQLRELLLGGAAIPAPLVERVRKLGLTPKVSYGLSEMSSQVCTGTPTAPGVVGTPLPGRQVKIEQGEICVRGETLFAGYLHEARLVSALDEQGWFHTRDKGHINMQGELVVEGRLDNMFVSGGENVQPELIEQRLVDHPAVLQTIVVAVADQQWGERPAAFIAWHREPLSGRELEAWLRETLPGYMVPRLWLPWPADEAGLKPSRQRLAALAKRAT
ncbi:MULTISPECIES: o-succinylbenzoate--CoA ligase [Halomonadaceae]|uniref:o-succinylbenzoate--CoA ligase n=1 Tax=Halomonadaceae TaxID=28256 RepID=UPI00159B1E8A|nr:MULTISPECIES: o-succinylbenzoate--CoA ligase [Halomonas]QJQ96370.1 o-succinylbenzoate--CoA ligase [Halomonas sp. PA5]